MTGFIKAQTARYPGWLALDPGGPCCFGPPASHRPAQQVAEACFGVGGLHSNEPAFAIGISESELGILHDSFVDVRDAAFDGRNQVNYAAVAMNGAHLLALADPLAALRERDGVKLASQLGSEIIHANADQAGAFAQRPGVAGMVTQILRNCEAADEGWLQAGSFCFRSCGNLHCGLHNCVAAAEMIDQQKTCECEEDQ